MADAMATDALAARPARSIASPRDLALRMAAAAHALRARVELALQHRDASLALVALCHACRAELAPALSSDEAADLVAQTATYALFVARYLHTGPDPFSRAELARLPAPHPWLRRLLVTLAMAERADEPWLSLVDECAGLLAATDIATLIAEPGAPHGAPDGGPLTTFYEPFLRAYDPALRRRRGVYLTPQPLVGYIVRSVDALLADELGIVGGLADGLVASGGLGNPGDARTSPVVVCDPACGVGAFLAAVVAHVHWRLREGAGTGASLHALQERPLLRLAGCELLPAPYLIGRLALGARLASLGALASPDARCEERPLRGVRLDIALGDALGELGAWPAWEAGESRVAAADGELDSATASDDAVLVILGNPPYSGHSANSGAAIAHLLRGVDPLDGGGAGSYFALDGAPLRERNLKWLNDDYVKFLRAAQWRIERAGRGILAFVTNSSYLENPTFRGMRRSLMRSFDTIHLLDLGGSGKRGERAPDGAPQTRDQNVFDIQEGVAIGLFVRRPGTPGPSREATVHHAELRGDRGCKLAWLAAHAVGDTAWSRLAPRAPSFGFTPRGRESEAEYLRGWPLTAILPEHSLGVLSKRDALVVGFTAQEALGQVAAFADPAQSDAECAALFGLPLRDKDGWDLGHARSALAGHVRPEAPRPLLYRPFDTRFVYYDPAVIARPNVRVMRHLSRENLALVVGRQGAATGSARWDVAFVTSGLADHNLFRRGGGTIFPLYLYDADGAPTNSRMANLDPRFVAQMSSQLGMRWLPDGAGAAVGSIGPEDALAYIYALLWAPSFRARYADFLTTEFPRLPLTSDAGLFRELCALGERLLALHLLRAAPLCQTRFPVSGSDRIERVRYTPPASTGEQGRVWINATQYFEGVAPGVWMSSVGGYRVAQKWLKDRTGRTLAQDELDRYQRALATLAETQATMAQIDASIARRGGWPFTGGA